ncbi:Cy61/Cy60 [Cynomolgus cytomegalovirus]|nr:Cy61/Cy60 [Cynomolgus cytomegalovirus]
MSYRLMSGMDDLRDTLMAYGCIAVRAQDPASLYTFVDQECGTKLHLAWPDNGYIQLRPRTLMGPFSSKYYDVCCQGKYVCCNELMEPFGVVELSKLSFYQLVMMIGRSGAIYCYEETEKCVYCLAPDMKSFIQLGLRRCDYLQKMELYQEPVIECDEIMKELMIFNWDVDRISDVVAKNGYRVYDIRDPLGEQVDSHFALWSSDTAVANFQDTSFSLMSPSGLRSFEIMVRCVARIVCVNQLLGVLGCFRKEKNEFLVRLYVLVDKFGTIYGFDPALNSIYRLAENMRMFTCMMGKKGYRNHRHDRKRAAIVRLEKVPYCMHGEEPSDPMIMFNDDSEDEKPPKTEADVVVGIYEAIKADIRFGVDMMMRDSSVTQKFWPQHLEALSDSPLLPSLVYDMEDVRSKMLGNIADMRAFDMSFVGLAEDNDSDREETVRGYLFDDTVCTRCVSSRRLRLFRSGRGMGRARVSYV